MFRFALLSLALLFGSTSLAMTGSADGTCPASVKTILGKSRSFPTTGESFDPAFLYTADEIARGRAAVANDRIRGRLFVIPQNDGEALRIQQILEAVGAPHVRAADPHQHAGLGVADFATLPAGVREVVLVENPSPELEAHLRTLGVAVKIIDHHGWGELDRYNRLSSLEQVAEDLGWPLTRMDRAIAINDRSFVGGLRAAGYSEDEIRRIRTFDLQAQGNPLSKLEREQRAAQDLIPTLDRVGAHILFDGTQEYLPNPSLLAQEVALHPSTSGLGVVELGVDRVKVSSTASVVEALAKLPWREWGYGENAVRVTRGGDREGSRYIYFGIREKPEGAAKKLPPEVKEKILAAVRAATN